MTFLKTLTIATAFSLTALATPSFAQTSFVKDKAMDMAKDQAMDMAKDKAMDMATDATQSMVTDGAKSMVTDGAKSIAVGKINDNTGVVMQKVHGAVQSPGGSTHAMDAVKATKIDIGVDKYGNKTYKNAGSVMGVKTQSTHPSQMVSCPTGTTLQSDNTCLITGNY